MWGGLRGVMNAMAPPGKDDEDDDDGDYEEEEEAEEEEEEEEDDDVEEEEDDDDDEITDDNDEGAKPFHLASRIVRHATAATASSSPFFSGVLKAAAGVVAQQPKKDDSLDPIILVDTSAQQQQQQAPSSPLLSLLSSSSSNNNKKMPSLATTTPTTTTTSYKQQSQNDPTEDWNDTWNHQKLSHSQKQPIDEQESKKLDPISTEVIGSASSNSPERPLKPEVGLIGPPPLTLPEQTFTSLDNTKDPKLVITKQGQQLSESHQTKEAFESNPKLDSALPTREMSPVHSKQVPSRPSTPTIPNDAAESNKLNTKATPKNRHVLPPSRNNGTPTTAKLQVPSQNSLPPTPLTSNAKTRVLFTMAESAGSTFNTPPQTATTTIADKSSSTPPSHKTEAARTEKLSQSSKTQSSTITNKPAKAEDVATPPRKISNEHKLQSIPANSSASNATKVLESKQPTLEKAIEATTKKQSMPQLQQNKKEKLTDKVYVSSSAPLDNQESSADTQGQVEEWKQKYQSLQLQLDQAEQRILQLQQEKQAQAQQEEHTHQAFCEKEARLLRAAAEEHEMESQKLQRKYEEQIKLIRQEHQRELASLQQRLATTQQQGLDARQKQTKSEQAQYQQELKRRERAVQMAQDQLATYQAKLEEAIRQNQQLTATIKDLNSHVAQHEDGAEAAEKEMLDLEKHNQQLQTALQKLAAEHQTCKEQLREYSHQIEHELPSLRLQVRLLQEEQERERAQTTQSRSLTETNTVQLVAARDAALASAQDYQRQYAAAMADLELARADYQRILMGHEQLQAAWEMWQQERQAEYELTQQQWERQLEARNAAHDAALEAARDAHLLELQQVQTQANDQIRNVHSELETLQNSYQYLKQENVQLRKSLDEAISRLQTTQEDVVDRTIMKNILLDWLQAASSAEKQQRRKAILQVMASLLHFTDDEKASVNILEVDPDHHHHLSLAQVLAFPPSKANVEQLPGDSVQEKWVNFLMAETE